jgi:hypothetical protein
MISFHINQPMGYDWGYNLLFQFMWNSKVLIPPIMDHKFWFYVNQNKSPSMDDVIFFMNVLKIKIILTIASGILKKQT